MMDAQFILDAIRSAYPDAALVPEVQISDDYWIDYHGIDTAPATRRIDALLWQARQITAIEVKVSVADFDRDTWLKRLPWQRVAHRFVYAVPAGLLDGRRVVPAGCGLWEVRPSGGVRVVQRAKVNNAPEPLPLSVVQGLAYRAARLATPDRENADAAPESGEGR
jgi:hypothetical protein